MLLETLTYDSTYHSIMKSVLIIGGGLAGLATAVGLAQNGIRCTILESRPRLGGRASSFTDPATGQLIDACQHVSMGCCTNFQHFCDTIGVGHLLAEQPRLYFITPDRRISLFQADPWPAPFHLSRALLSAHYLTATEKLRIMYGVAALLCESPEADPPLLPWLMQHQQTAQTLKRFWEIILISALNDSVENVGLKYARKVFRDGFMRHRKGFTVSVPTVPLVQLYGTELYTWLQQQNTEVVLSTGVKQLEAEQGRITSARLRDGRIVQADAYICAVPFERLHDLFPQEIMGCEPMLHRVQELKPSPITSVHIWFDRPVMQLPHAVLMDGISQWVFNRNEVNPGEYYLQVVVSASFNLNSRSREEIEKIILGELNRNFPKVEEAKVLRTKVITEHAATFRAVPGVDALRPAQATNIPNLFLAGDYTRTGWPATMEGAVRSGYLAAEAVLQSWGISAKLLQPELG